MTVISDFFAGKSVFITGVTGFMGKVLLEKLMRSCPDILRLYVLMRPKRGLDVTTRLSQLFDSKLFQEMKETKPDLIKKVVPLTGDILTPEFGLNSADSQLLITEVSIVFHLAATVKFDDLLKMAIQMNVIGVNRLIDLCHKMRKLEALVHVSTAYANCDRDFIDEIVYPPPLDYEKIVNGVGWKYDDICEDLTLKLIKPRPNTYTYSKAIAEHLIVEQCGSLPCAIVRPSIVLASWNEPIRGWVDNFNGPNGNIVVQGKGILRVMMGNVNAISDVVPVDLAVNCLIAAAWSTATERPAKPLVYNFTTGQLNGFSWGQLEREICKSMLKNPLDGPIRLPTTGLTLNKIYYEVNKLFNHLLPAWVMDVGLRIAGRKPMMLHIQNKIWKAMSSLEFFTCRQWTFSNNNVIQLFAKLTDVDQREFNFDVKQIHWPTYVENVCLGIKQYALKEDLSKMPEARKAIKRLLLMKRITNFIGIVSFCWFIVRNRIIRQLIAFARFLLLRVCRVLSLNKLL